MGHSKPTPIFVGMNDRDAPTTLERGWLARAWNIIARSSRADAPVRTRPGLVRYNATAIATSPCQGLFAYRDGAAEALIYAAATNKLYHSDDLTTALTLNKTWTWAADDLLSFVMGRIGNTDRVYICTGSDDGGQNDSNMVFDGTDVHPMGIAAPAAAPTGQANGAGNLNGEYSWKYSYYDSTLDRHGPASAAYTDTATNNTWELTLVAPGDSTYDKAAIYRTEAGGTKYRFLAYHTFGGGPDLTYDDNTADDDLSADEYGEGGDEIHDQAPRCKCAWPLSDGRIALANDVSNGKKRWVYICYDADHLEEFPYRKEAGPENGAEIVCGVPFGEASAIICEDSIYLLNDTCTDCDLRVPDVGGVGRWCASPSKYGAFFVSRDGVYLFTGYDAKLLSGPIEGTWSTIEATMLPKCVCCYISKLDLLLVAVCTTASGTVNDTILALDCGTLGWDDPRWSVWPNVRAEAIVHIAAATAGTTKTYLSLTGGIVGTLSETTKNDLAGSGTVSGTVTSAGNTTLTDSGAAFLTTGSGLKAAPVDIVAGTGAGQRRWIASNTATQLTVSAAWTTNPSTDSEYQIGPIPWDLIGPEEEMGEPDFKKFFRSISVLAEQPS